MRDPDFYRTLLDNLFDGVYFVASDGTISYWNKAAERLTGYAAEEILGRSCADGRLMHTDAEGHRLCHTALCPAKLAMEREIPLEMQVFFQHKEGHRVPALTRIVPLRDDDGGIIGAVEVFSDSSAAIEAQEQMERLREAALIDPVTGVGNRRFGEAEMRTKLEQLRRYGWAFSLLFLDIDGFKGINDRHGHAVGDRVLRMVAQTLTGGVRLFDRVVRWGGEEFLVLLSNIREVHLFVQADRIRRLVEHSSLPLAGGPLGVTISIGGSVALPDDSIESLVERVDALMYRSKEAGRNSVTIG